MVKSFMGKSFAAAPGPEVGRARAFMWGQAGSRQSSNYPDRGYAESAALARAKVSTTVPEASILGHSSAPRS
jgi:hypothetical protein